MDKESVKSYVRHLVFWSTLFAALMAVLFHIDRNDPDEAFRFIGLTLTLPILGFVFLALSITGSGEEDNPSN
jgi:hypothetical protein